MFKPTRCYSRPFQCIISVAFTLYLMNARKGLLCSFRTTQADLRLRSLHSESMDNVVYVVEHGMLKVDCMCLSGPTLSEHCIQALFVLSVCSVFAVSLRCQSTQVSPYTV